MKYLALPIMALLMLPQLRAEEGEAPPAIPKEIGVCVSGYYHADDSEDEDAWKEVHHPNAPAAMADPTERWKNYDKKTTISGIKILHMDDEMALLDVTTNQHIPQYPLSMVRRSWIMLRKYGGVWKVWLNTELEAKKVG